MSSTPSSSAPEAPPVTQYDVASFYLIMQQGDPHQFAAVLEQLRLNCGPGVLMVAAQNLLRVAEDMRWRAYAATAAAQGQPLPQVPPYLMQPNPYAVPNISGAARVIAEGLQTPKPETPAT